jgi:APA family basic amino acid/polyamine antiporter
MMVSLPRDTWIRLVVWLIIGMVLYFFYGRHHSRVQLSLQMEPKLPPKVMVD